ncbi:MAG: beta-lactamase family protein [Bacteroidales bacterium]|nr:beta-lactamase family protein [Bacteroidales bacterium]
MNRLLFSAMIGAALLTAACSSRPESASTALPRGESPVNTAEFDKVFDDVTAVRGDSLHSLMVIKDGKVIYERYAKGHNADEAHVMNSVSKSFLSVAVGFAVQEGLMTVQDKVVKYFTDEELPPADERNPWLNDLTVHDLLRMSSGFQHGNIDRQRSTNWAKDVFAIPQTWQPGTRFNYNSMNSYLLSVIVSRVTGEKVNDYLQDRLFTPLGIESHEWQESPQGYNAGGWGMYITTESLAKISLFVLQKGMWNGKQLLGSSWFDEACKAQIMEYEGEDISPEEAAVKYAGDQWNMGYGYQFWMDAEGGCRLDGARGQFGIVMPDKNAVIATTADVRNNKILFYSAWEHIHDQL